MKQKKEIPEAVIPAGYKLDEVMDFDDDDFGEEKPILIQALDPSDDECKFMYCGTKMPI